MERERERAGRAEARAEQVDRQRMRMAVALTAFVVFGLAAFGVSESYGAIDPTASAVLAGALKPEMQKTLKKQVPGLVVTTVKCYVPSASAQITGPCTAKFTVGKYGLKGAYKTKATLSNKSKLSWSTTSVSCSDLHGRRAACNGQTSSGSGLISAQLAETQLLRQGIVVKNATKKVSSALCTGSKAKRWVHGKFDDVFSQLRCVAKTADGSYGLVFRMAGQGYNLTGDQEAVRRLAPFAAAAGLLLVPAALAATPADIKLAGQLKTQMQRTYSAKAPGTTITAVTCKINAARTGATCAAHFTRRTQNLKGVYQVTVAADSTGNADWKATSATCANLRTGARVKC